MADWIVLFLFGVVVPVTGLGVLLPRALDALRTSSFVSHGFRTTRNNAPFRFWLAIVMWFFMSAFSVFIGVFALWNFFAG